MAKKKTKKKTKAKKKKIRTNQMLIITIVLVLAAAFFLRTTFNHERNVQIILMKPDCTNCFDIKPAVEALQQKFNITISDFEELTQEESIKIAKKYNITRLPALIIKGDISKINLPDLVQVDEALVFTKSPPPYYDITERKIKGIVDITILDPKCEQCFDVTKIVDQLENLGMQANKNTISTEKPEGKELIRKYKIEKLPTLIFSKDAYDYPYISQIWNNVGSIEEDALILRLVNPPYLDLKTNTVKGVVDLTYIDDESCDECYPPEGHKQTLEQTFNIALGKEKTIDINSKEGKQIIEQYNITLIPTVILSSEAKEYPTMAKIWQTVGTVEKDGTFIFRRLDLITNATYKNLTSEELITS